MTPADIAAIEARVAAATPGPWRPQADTNRNGTPARSRWRGIYEPVPGQELGSRSCVMNASYKGMEPDDIWISCAAADMDLIAHAPTDLARLLADRRELVAELEALEGEKSEWEGIWPDWAEKILAILKRYGFEDHDPDGIDLPDCLATWLDDYDIDRACRDAVKRAERAEARATAAEAALADARNMALEEAAKVADRHQFVPGGDLFTHRAIATRIRALRTAIREPKP